MDDEEKNRAIREAYAEVRAAQAEKAALIHVDLSAPDTIEWTYSWAGNGPVVTNRENRRVRVTLATVTYFPDEDAFRVHAEGEVIKADGSKNKRFTYRVTAHGSGVEDKILAAHLEATNSREGERRA